MGQIGIGDTIPDFQLKDQHGNIFDIRSVRGEKKLVIFFYPQDGSLNCTKEACYFRDLTEAFDETGAIVLGISGQSVESHKAFAESNRLTYLILSDEDNKVRKLFGVPSNVFGLVPGRVTYVVDVSGTVRYIFNSQTDVSGHVDEALKICLLLKKTEFGYS
jgi:thioredoxin-dependent peroxiredoxin